MTPHEYLVKDIIKPHIWARYQEKDYRERVVPISQQDFEMWLERMNGLFKDYKYIGRRGIIDLFLVDRFPQTLLASSKLQVSYQLRAASKRAQAIESAPRDTRDAIDLNSFYSQFKNYIEEMLGVQDIGERYIVKEANLFKNIGRYFPFYELKSLQELYQEYSRDGQTTQEVKKHFVEVLWRFIPEDYRPQRFNIKALFVLERERVKKSTRGLLKINYSEMDGREYMKPEYRKKLFKFLKNFEMTTFKTKLQEMEEAREDMTMKKYLLRVVKEKYWKEYKRQNLEGLISEAEVDNMIEREEFRALFPLEEKTKATSSSAIAAISAKEVIIAIKQDIKVLGSSLRLKLKDEPLSRNFWQEVKEEVWMPLRQEVGKTMIITEDLINKWIKGEAEAEEEAGCRLREIRGKKRFTLIRSDKLLSHYLDAFKELERIEKLKKVTEDNLKDLFKQKEILEEKLKISEEHKPFKYKEFNERLEKLKIQYKVVEAYITTNSVSLSPRRERNYPLCFLNYKQK